MVLDVPLSIQHDDKSCGHQNVSMVAQFHGHPEIPIDAPLFRKHQREDGILDSFGISGAFSDLRDDGFVFFGSDSLSQIIEPNGEINDLDPVTAARLSGLKKSKNCFLMEWCRYDEHAKSVDGSTAYQVVTGDNNAQERFPNPIVLLEDLINEHQLPAITPVDFKLINASCGLLHNLTTTGVSKDFITCNNSGPEPNHKKDQIIGRGLYEEAWKGADFDLLIYFKDKASFRKFILALLETILFTGSGIWVHNMPEMVWQSVTRMFKGDEEVINKFKTRLDIMNMPTGTTATLCRRILDDLR